MENFLDELQQQRDSIESIATKIEQGKAYREELNACLPLLNQTIITLFDITQDTSIPLEINPDYVLQVLNDILYGIEQEDSVYLADVLRYGLIEIFDYIGTELQREAPDE